MLESFNSGKHYLNIGDQMRWRELEDLLIAFTENLIANHKYRPFFPSIQYPRLPRQYGYLHEHVDKEMAIRCVRRSRDAFRTLCAIASFAISIWLTEHEDDCFEEAFEMLSKLPDNPIPRHTLVLLEKSVVCSFSPSLRPGAFVDPYKTGWGFLFHRMGRAGLSLWLLWGQEDDYNQRSCFDNEMRKVYFPPSDFIEKSKTRVLGYEKSPILPHYESMPTEGSSFPAQEERPTLQHDDDFSDGPFHGDQPPPLANPTLQMPEGSRQRPGENWDQFRDRLTAALQKRIAHETPEERYSRLDLEKEAKRGFNKRVTVFTWEADDQLPTFYKRQLLDRSQMDSIWASTTAAQRFFWSHLREWDILEHLPRDPNIPASLRNNWTSEELEDEYGPDDTLTTQDLPRDSPTGPIGETLLQEIRKLAASYLIEAEGHGVVFLSLSDYLFLRHGFRFSPRLGIQWHNWLHDPKDKFTLPETNSKLVMARLLFERSNDNMVDDEHVQCLVDFHNTAIAVLSSRPLKHTDLPSCWDLSPSNAGSHLATLQTNILLERSLAPIRQLELLQAHQKDHAQSSSAKVPLYILRPVAIHENPSEWFIATTDPTTVLLVYRKGWKTMASIARGLLELGIPFRTVIKHDLTDDRPPEPSVVSSRGLGFRDADFKPGREDYLDYLNSRQETLLSYAGRVIRTRGGIAGRIAAEYVKEIDVLQGPSMCNEIVGFDDDGHAYLDDFVPSEQLDIVCGVYKVRLRRDVISNLSWWPQQSTWRTSGFDSDHWTPDAEAWYQDHLKNLNTNDHKLSPKKIWKGKLKRFRACLQRVLDGSVALAAQFIETEVGRERS